MTITTDMGPFAIVPEWVMSHPEIGGTELLVYLALAMRASRKTNTCWPGHETIGEDVGISVPTVKRSLTALRNAGAVSWKRTGSSNIYTVHQVQKVVDSSSVGDPQKADSSSVSDHDRSSVSYPIDHPRAINNNQEQETKNHITTTRQAEEQTEVKTNFEEFPVRQQTEISAADWDDSPETRNAMAQRIAKEFYVALKSTKNKRPAVKHKQMVALIDDLIERGYTEDEIGQIFSAHYKSKSPWTLNSIAFTEAKINEKNGNDPSFEGWTQEEIEEYKRGESMLGRVMGSSNGN